jgi:hypothetical protein
LGKSGSILVIDTISKCKIRKRITIEDVLQKAKSRITRKENKLKKANHTIGIKTQKKEKKNVLFSYYLNY